MILSIGDLVLDITIVPSGRLRPNDDNPAVIRVGGGGQAANFCAWVAALGSPVRLVTRVGDDDRGRRLVREVEELGVEVFAVSGLDPTGMIAVLVGPNGERTMATQRGASAGLRPDDLRKPWFRGVNLIHVPGYSLFVEPLAASARLAIELVRHDGGLVSIDLSSAAGLKEYGAARFAAELAVLKPDLLFATAAESEKLGVPMEGLAKVPVLKLGASGCRVEGRHIPAPQVQEVDATGAGDALAAAFCVTYLDGATPIEAAEKAVVVASGAVTRTGARPS
ncbi:MAG TPA: PfkB family carbohydrate kinase [Candidatus Dormibacteraeota bacterium]|jgi:sugar/nucleoside kinase (ribokinase family)|nr:PfkB family carbohydrate kinase [Candidatus Dormibacteraeota bacterium]